MLTSRCNNLSTHHYYLTYHPCFDTQFCQGQTRPDLATIFSRCCHAFKKKAKAIELLFFAKESGKKDWADKIVASDAARVRESCAGQLCGGDFVALFISADHVDQKATCIVSYPA